MVYGNGVHVCGLIRNGIYAIYTCIIDYVQIAIYEHVENMKLSIYLLRVQNGRK
jgi:hypothetical protein